MIYRSLNQDRNSFPLSWCESWKTWLNYFSLPPNLICTFFQSLLYTIVAGTLTRHCSLDIRYLVCHLLAHWKLFHEWFLFGSYFSSTWYFHSVSSSYDSLRFPILKMMLANVLDESDLMELIRSLTIGIGVKEFVTSPIWVVHWTGWRLLVDEKQ